MGCNSQLLCWQFLYYESVLLVLSYFWGTISKSLLSYLSPLCTLEIGQDFVFWIFSNIKMLLHKLFGLIVQAIPVAETKLKQSWILRKFPARAMPLQLDSAVSSSGWKKYWFFQFSWYRNEQKIFNQEIVVGQFMSFLSSLAHTELKLCMFHKKMFLYDDQIFVWDVNT